MLSISSQGTKMIYIRTSKLVTYGIQIYDFGKLSRKSSQALYLFSTLRAEEWQQLPDQIKVITLKSVLQIKVTGQTPDAKISGFIHQ